MSDARTQLIRLVLLDGDPAGLRSVTIANRTTVLTGCPISRLGDLKTRDEAQRPAVYFLTGEEGDGSGVIYVGECDSLADRFKAKHHAMDKADWRQVVVASTTDGVFNKAHARRAEHLLVARAKDLDRFKVMTDQTSPGKLDEGDAALAREFVANVVLLAEIMGVSAFRPKPSKPSGNQASVPGPDDGPVPVTLDGPVFRIAGVKGVDAKLRTDGEGFLLLGGSQAKAAEAPSCPPMARTLRAQAIKSGALVAGPTPGLLTFTGDLPVPSTSTAGSVVSGNSISGPASWVHEGTNQTYAEWVQSLSVGAEP